MSDIAIRMLKLAVVILTVVDVATHRLTRAVSAAAERPPTAPTDVRWPVIWWNCPGHGGPVGSDATVASLLNPDGLTDWCPVCERFVLTALTPKDRAFIAAFVPKIPTP